MATLAGLPPHQWWGWMSQAVNCWGTTPCLQGKPAGFSIPIGSHRFLLKLMTSYFRTWFLMHILSKEIPDERNTQIVQKEDKPMILKQAWEQVPVKLIACMWIDKLRHVCSLHFHAVSLLQERTQRRQGQGMSHAGAVSSRQKPRNLSDTSLDGKELVRRKEGNCMRVKAKIWRVIYKIQHFSRSLAWTWYNINIARA